MLHHTKICSQGGVSNIYLNVGKYYLKNYIALDRVIGTKVKAWLLII